MVLSLDQDIAKSSPMKVTVTLSQHKIYAEG